MYVLNNPVLQRELVANLRKPQGFFLLAIYLLALGLVVWAAWPSEVRIEVASEARPEASRRLVNMFFFGQYVLAALIAPTFAAGAIAGEKEQRTFELLLTTPLPPLALILGKLLAAQCNVLLLVFSSLPIVMLCLPLGGTSLYEVLAFYTAVLLSTFTFGMVSLAASSVFRRRSAALLVSYLVILPLVLVGVLVWQAFAGDASLRLLFAFAFLPIGCALVWLWLTPFVRQRLIYPPDLGSEGQEVFDEERELKQAVGLVIRRDHFPDRLFAPPRRADFVADGVNPVYDKEIHADIFSQGTLMLRIVIQVSMILAVPLMGVCLFFLPQYARWYVNYVLLFNVLVGPVFSAGAVTSERERGTLELLLTTILSPWTILWGKLLSGLRVSTVLTLFLTWPLLLALGLNEEFWRATNLAAAGWYLAIILMTCVTTAVLGLFCSVMSARTTLAMLATYLVVLVVFFGPLVWLVFAQTFYAGAPAAALIERLGVVSPFSAAYGVPFVYAANAGTRAHGAQWPLPALFLAVHALGNAALLGLMVGLFRRRWATGASSHV